MLNRFQSWDDNQGDGFASKLIPPAPVLSGLGAFKPTTTTMTKTNERHMMKHKLAVLCSILLALALSAHASWFSDYPPKALDIVAQPIDHYFVKDELAFALSSAVWLKDVVLVCELRYKDKTRTITKTQATWSAVGAIKIELPDNLTDLKTVHLTGTFKTLEICKDGKFQLIDGYKIDSEFDMTHTTSSQ